MKNSKTDIIVVVFSLKINIAHVKQYLSLMANGLNLYSYFFLVILTTLSALKWSHIHPFIFTNAHTSIN